MGSEIKLVIKKQEIEDFLRYIFNSRKGPILINRSTDIGRVIHALKSYSPTPVVQSIPPGENVVRIILPDHRTSTDKWKYVYFTRENTDRINDFLLASFNIFFQSYMLAGDQMNIDQKDLLEAFLSGTGIRDVGKKYETFKKKDYRHRKKVHDFLVNALQVIGIHSNKKNISELSPSRGQFVQN